MPYLYIDGRCSILSFFLDLGVVSAIEYYDRGLPQGRLLPASRAMQDEYWLLRSVLCAAIAASWTGICDCSSEVAKAALAFDSFLRAHPARTFSVFRPEDVALERVMNQGRFCNHSLRKKRGRSC